MGPEDRGCSTDLVDPDRLTKTRMPRTATPQQDNLLGVEPAIKPINLNQRITIVGEPKANIRCVLMTIIVNYHLEVRLWAGALQSDGTDGHHGVNGVEPLCGN